LPTYPLDDDLAMARLVSAGLPVTAIRKLGAALGLRPLERLRHSRLTAEPCEDRLS
jgi:hypothetical protein